MAKRINKLSSIVTEATKPKKVRIDNLKTITTKTKNQELTKVSYKTGYNLLLHGIAGTGKTFLSLLLALEEVLDPSTEFEKVVIVRSVVPTREIGFLKGGPDEKISVYEAPYVSICEELFNVYNAYALLKEQGTIEFISTSFIRGSTLTNAIVIVDECENLNLHELDSVITRVGKSTKIIFSGDYSQSDFTKDSERKGLLYFMKVLKSMNSFAFVEFTIDDIVRSDLVKEYIIAKYKMGIDT